MPLTCFRSWQERLRAALRQWEASVIEEILTGTDASIELVILNRAPSTPRTLRTRIAGLSLPADVQLAESNHD